MELKCKPKVKHVEMPCWTGKVCWVEVARPICVFHFGQASVMWEARCDSSPLPPCSCCALCSWSIPSPTKTAVYLGGELWFGLRVFFWLFIPWRNTIPATGVEPAQQRLQQVPPWYPGAQPGAVLWHPRFPWHEAGSQFAALVRSKNLTRACWLHPK